MFFDSSDSICKLKLLENSNCSNPSECFDNLLCVNNTCQCAMVDYYASNLKKCVPKTLNNTACTTDHTCRTDLGLSCQNSTCQCNSTYKFWKNTASSCINYLSFGDVCIATKECNATSLLYCSGGKCMCVCLIFSICLVWDLCWGVA